MPESALGDMHSAFSVVFVLRLIGLLADERAVNTRLKIPLESKQPGAMFGQMLIYSEPCTKRSFAAAACLLREWP